MFYIFCDVEHADAFWVTNDDGLPRSFKTEAEAITEAKEYSCTSLIVRPVARVVEQSTHKVEKIK